LALVANVALLMNMAKRLKFQIAQPITIVGWFISGFLLVALVAVSNSSSSGFRPDIETYNLTQAFYYAIIAAGMYCVIASLMIVTVYGAYTGHYKKEFRLTNAQRTLMLQTIMFMGYLLLGALVYSNIEGWRYLDAVFWANFTLLTIGLGSPFVPMTHLGRALLFPYAIGGILTVGLVIGSIRSLVLERGVRKIEARFLEKKREASLRTYNSIKSTIKVSLFKKLEFNPEGLTESQRREQEFYLMREIQEQAAASQRWMSLFMSSSATLILWLVGAAVFAITEREQGWSYFTAIYFAYTSLLTIGYGDFQPQSNSGKPFFIFWTLLAVPTLTILISHMGDTVIKAVSNVTIWAGSITILPHDEGFTKTVKLFFKQFSGGSGGLSPDDFHMDKPPGFLPYSSEDKNSEKEEAKLDQLVLDRLAEHVEAEEIEDAVQAPDKETRDQHLYNYVLVREFKEVAKNVRTNPHKKYNYGQWAWYLKLLRQDESDPTFHRMPEATVKGKATNELGRADNDDGQKWSWLGVRSPLLSTMTESEWLVWRIGEALESEMHGLRVGKLEKPPISLDDLLKRQKDEKREKKEEHGEYIGDLNQDEVDTKTDANADEDIEIMRKKDL
jgi:potassium channel subfamily K, other eukaryote